MKIRIFIFISLIAATFLCCKFMVRDGVNSEIGVVVWLPDEYKGMIAKEVRVSDEELKWLPSDTINYKKSYIDKQLDEQIENSSLEEGQKSYYRTINSLNATLIVAGSDSRSLHNPKVCLVSQAWNITKEKVEILNTDGGELEVMTLFLEREVLDRNRELALDENGNKILQKAVYVYWWIGPDDSTPYIEKRILYSLINSVKKGANERWAYPSFMAYSKDASAQEVENTSKRLYEFINRLAPLFQKSLGAMEIPVDISNN